MSIFRDLRYSLREWKKQPLTTVVIILALSVGIGVNASSFVGLNAMVLRPLPYPELDRIAAVWESPVGQAGEWESASVANYLDWKQQSRSFESLSAFRRWDANLSGNGDPERVLACLVTPEFFHVLGMKPALGRTLRPGEAEPGQSKVALVSLGFWKSRLGGNPAVLGTSLTLNGAAYTIVGVMPHDFNFPLETEVWAPLAWPVAEQHDRKTRSLAILGRLRPGLPVAQAQSEMSALARRLAAQYPETNENLTAKVVSLRSTINNVTDRFCMSLLATAGFVLLLACANVANLLLVRLANRRREIAIRTAIGSSRARTARLLIGETLIIALLSGGVGLYLASWDLVLIKRFVPVQVLQWVAGLRDMRIDGTVVLFTFAASVVVALLCVAPSLLHLLSTASGRELNEALKDTGRGSSAGRGHIRLRSVLATSEVALALILLIGAGMMVRTFQSFANANPGYDTKKLLKMEIALPPTNYPTAPQHSAFYERLLRGIGGLPAVRSGAVRAMAGDAEAVYIEGRAVPRPGELRPSVASVSGRFFETLGLPVVQGRGIRDSDDQGFQRVVVVSESVARQFWPGGSPVGSRVRLSKNEPWHTVVGVCGDVKDWFSNLPTAIVYTSFRQAPQPAVTLLMRTAGDPMAAVSAARAEVLKVDRTQPVFDVKSMQQVIEEETSGVRSAAISMVTYAFIALFLAASGVYAVISYSMAQRTHEIGIRMALGARPGDVLGMAMRASLRVGGVGLAIGLPVAFGMVKLLSSVLYGVIRMDAATFIGLTLLLAFCSALAGYIPAVRATRVDPLEALRTE
jgi:putative ABC transport system permease protein